MKFNSLLTVSPTKFGIDTLKSAIPILAILYIGPLFYSNSFFFFVIAVLIIATNSLNIVYGFTGYLPFGFAVFLAFGAYIAAMSINLLHLPMILSVLIGGLSSAGLSIAFTPLLKLSGAYFAIASLATFEAVYYIMSNLSLRSYTGGPYGISPNVAYTPSLDFGLIALTAVVSSIVILYIRHSNFGLALRAINDDRVSVQLSGVNSHLLRSIAWIVSTFLVGIAGGLYGVYLGFFYPTGVFDLTLFSVLVIIFLLFGGRGSYLGPIIGTVLLYVVYQEVFLNYPDLAYLVFGVIVIFLILFMPDGIMRILSKHVKGVF